MKSQDRVWQHRFLSPLRYWAALLNVNYYQYFHPSAQIRKLDSVFKTSWGELHKEKWTRQESKNETLCVHKHRACPLLCLAPKALPAAHAHTQHVGRSHHSCAKRSPIPNALPCIPPVFLVLIWALVQLWGTYSFNAQAKFTRQGKAVVNCLRKCLWLNTTFYLSGNHSFKAVQFTDLDHQTASQMLAPVLGGDGTEVWTTLEVDDSGSSAGLWWSKVYMKLAASLFFPFCLWRISEEQHSVSQSEGNLKGWCWYW